MSNEKHHYRKVFKSDHLGVADLEDFLESDARLIFTISHVRQEYGVKVAGRKGDHNIAYFAEDIKPLVVNATNSKVLKGFTGSSFVEDWQNISVELYIDPTAKLAGEVVGGVRISPNKPRLEKNELTPEKEKAWNNAVAAYQRDKNFDAIEKRMAISDQNKQAIIEAANAVS